MFDHLILLFAEEEMDFSRLSIFKLPNKHKRFEYVPRYYDARKERLKKKIEDYELENKTEAGERKRREISFRDKSSNRWGGDDYKAASLRQNLRLILILGILGVIVYYIFVGIEGIEPLVEIFYK